MFSSYRTDNIFSSLIIVLGLYVAYTGITLGYMSQGTPGPGFFSTWIGSGLVALSAWNLMRAAKKRDRLQDISKREAAYVVVASAATAAFIVVAYLLGMLPAIFLLMLAIGVIFGPREQRFYFVLFGLCIVMTSLIYLVFNVLLGVPAF